jgi:lipoprotein-anchoring transpeptidase ErfK/SrfK
MPITRRTLLGSALASGLVGAAPALALTGEPFPVKDNEGKKLPYKFQRRITEYETREPPGTIVVDTGHRILYLVLPGGQAIRYGCSVGKGANDWTGEAIVRKMAKWPVWVPTPDHLKRYPSLAKWVGGMPGGPENPMGARALYLFQGEVDTTYRIHGATKPGDIGRKMTAGCIGLLNIDVIDLYERVQIGTRVVVTG